MQLDRYRECLRLGRHDQADAFVRVIQPDASQYDLCRSCGFLRWSQGEPNVAAMKRAFVAAWPFMQQVLTCAWAGPHKAEQLPDAPFIAALQAAWGERHG